MNTLSNSQTCCTVEEILNSVFDEEVVYFTWENQKIGYDDVRIAKKVQREGNGLIMPNKEDLCPYGQVMYEYLSERDIEIPERRSAKSYLRETGYLYDFYEYQRNLLIQEMKSWLEHHKIKSIELI